MAAHSISNIFISIKLLSGEMIELATDPSLGLDGIKHALHKMDPEAYPRYYTTVFPLHEHEQLTIQDGDLFGVFVHASERLVRVLLTHCSRFDKNYLPEPCLRFEFDVDRTTSLSSFEMEQYYRQPYPLTKEQEVQLHPKQQFYIIYLPQTQSYINCVTGYTPRLRTSGSYFEWKENDLAGCLEDVIGKSQSSYESYTDISPHPDDLHRRPSYRALYRFTSNASNQITQMMTELLPLYTHLLPPPCQTEEEIHQHRARSRQMALEKSVPRPVDVTTL